ncbi:PREDICTED: uncharacterized protein LOC105153540 [Acromyrmex echinatior]|uniref:uncharacterized protein LOC105153540 n=1 Tax=Acromyrmex echinatior TaxID=103372 RepID=UPI000580FE2C|nr:PREDICTED: uncharacterized protein LOC105153540 [Acromyrmex echinatior]
MKCGYFGVIEWSRKIGYPRVIEVSCWIFILLIVCSRRTHSLAFDNTTDLFVQKCEMECDLKRDYTTCGKYKVAKWLNTIVREKEFSYGPFRIIRIPSIYKQSFLPYLPRSQAFKSGITEALNFVRDSVEDLLTKRAIVYTIDNSAVARDARDFSSNLMFMDEDELERLKDSKEPEGDWRIFKKKKNIIFPILILLNLIKLKLLLLPIFLGVHFIKKLLVLGSLILPSVFAHLKICKVQHPHAHHAHPFHLWSTAADATVDYPTGYGTDDSNWHRNDYQLGYPSYQILRNPYG